MDTIDYLFAVSALGSVALVCAVVPREWWTESRRGAGRGSDGGGAIGGGTSDSAACADGGGCG